MQSSSGDGDLKFSFLSRLKTFCGNVPTVQQQVGRTEVDSSYNQAAPYVRNVLFDLRQTGASRLHTLGMTLRLIQ